MASLDLDQLRHRVLAEKVKAVAIDTSIFHKNGYRLSDGLFALVDLLPKNNLEIIVPDIVQNEVQVHVEKQKGEARSAVEASLKRASKQGLISEGEVDQCLALVRDPLRAARESLDDFFHVQIGATVIESAHYADLADVVARYFGQVPPFEERKKTEFPDAIALSALERWAASEDTQMIVVSADAGWLEVTSSSERLHGVESLEIALAAVQVTQEGLAEATASAILTDQRATFVELLNQSLSTVGIAIDAYSSHYVEVEPIEQTITGFTDESVSGDLLQQVASEDGQFILAIKAELSIDIECQPSFEIYDPIDKDVISITGNSFTLSDKFDADLLITVMMLNQQAGEPLRVHICKVEFTDLDLTFEAGEVDLDLTD